jgi:hypothetical protein
MGKLQLWGSFKGVRFVDTAANEYTQGKMRYRGMVVEVML